MDGPFGSKGFVVAQVFQPVPKGLGQDRPERKNSADGKPQAIDRKSFILKMGHRLESLCYYFFYFSSRVAGVSKAYPSGA